MPDIRETKLPGVGIEYDFTTRSGDHVGVIARHSGRKEVVLYDPHDPDSVKSEFELDASESASLAELLGGSRITATLEALTVDIEGLVIDWIPLAPTFTTISIAATEMRTRTGCSVIAIMRDGVAIPAPGPDDELMAGDTAVIVGTKDGLAAVATLLGG
jgi:TrkA domain protein